VPFLPKYLRLLLLLYKHGELNTRERRKHGYTLNDVAMLEALGLLERHGPRIKITSKGREVVEQEIKPYICQG